ncbi:hypothetical protein ACFL7M_08825 [Thermodesulfobacteriota bacterium]
MDFLPIHKFRQIVERYQGNKGSRTNKEADLSIKNPT